jgi:hypothetical protein
LSSYWTLKQSHIKARKLGVVLPLDQMPFLVDDEISVVFDARFAEHATSWRFSLFDAPRRHMITLSLKTGGTSLSLRATRVVPLRRKHD